MTQEEATGPSRECDHVELPVTRQVASSIPDWTSPVLVVQHVRPDTAAFIQVLLEANIKVSTVVAIPYSSDDACVAKLSDSVRMLCPGLDEMSATAAAEVRALSQQDGRRVVVQDVGGYFADALRGDPTLGASIRGIAEETKQGLWRYRNLENCQFPVVQIADSRLKQIEARYVGAAVALSALEATRCIGNASIGERIAVVGYGDIGAACARTVRGIANTVYIWDTDPIQRIAAAADGFMIATPEEIVGNCRLIIGCTGKESVGQEWFADVSGDYYLASGSSRDIEFRRLLNWGAGRSQDYTISQYARRVPVTRIDLDLGRLHVLRGGLPINFESASLPYDIIDLVFAQLLVAMVEVELGDEVGLRGLSDDGQHGIASAWLSTHGATGHASIRNDFAKYAVRPS